MLNKFRKIHPTMTTMFNVEAETEIQVKCHESEVTTLYRSSRWAAAKFH